MPRVITTAKVEDGAKWEQGFRTHADLFRSMTIGRPIHFSVTGENEVAIIFEPDDLEKYQQVFDSSATEEAMAFDGVKRETVKVYILDKEFDVA